MKSYTLNNGMNIPAIGFGCYNAKGGDNYQMIKDAISSGYTLFDTASIYETEVDLGKAIKDSGVSRNDLFIQSKLWIDEMGYDNAKAALERTLKRLDTDYLDVYFIHWPRQNPIQDHAPGHPDVICPDKDYPSVDDWKTLEIDTYRALEEAVKEGKIKAIGLSNFLPHHLMNILDNCEIKPVLDQLEYHLGYTQDTAVNFAKENGIVVQAWSPLCRGMGFDDPLFTNMANKYGISTSQLALSFICQNGVIPLPKSASISRQKENLSAAEIVLEKEDYYILSCIVPNGWTHEHPDFVIPGRASRK